MESTSFLQTQTILRALEYGVAKGAFANNPRQKKAALGLIKDMKSNSSVSGRHQQLMALLERGASIDQMMRATKASRRTIFRYLNHFEEAGVDIVIDGGQYRLK